MERRVRIHALVIGAVAMGIALFPPLRGLADRDDAPDPASVRASLERGIAWLLEQEMRRTDAMLFGLWIAEAAAPQLPGPAGKLREKSLVSYRERWPDELFLRKLIGGKKRLPADKTEADRQLDRALAHLADGSIGQSGVGPQDFLLVSLYAGDPYVRGRFDEVFEVLFARPLPRYGVTHQLLALDFLRGEDVFPEARIQDTMDRYAAEVAESIDHDLLVGTYTDLMAERMAMLARVGGGDRLAPAWVGFAMANQRENGRWEVEPSSVSPAGRMSDADQHITVLSLYALARYLQPIRPLP